MSVSNHKWAVKLLPAIAMVLASGSAWADKTLNMRRGITPVSNEVYDLHMIVLWICVIIGIGVFGAMIYSMMNHTKAKNPTPATFHENHKLEVIWTIIPFVILVGLAIPATKTLLDLEDASNPDMTIKVTGYQWKWQYEYMDGDAEGVKFFSALDAASNEARQKGANKDLAAVDNYLLNVDNRVVVPVGKKIRFLMTAEDVLHAWWVPDFGFKNSEEQKQRPKAL